MYEELTVEDVKSEILSRISTDIDIREGSFTNDVVSAVSYEIWKAYQSLDAIIPIAYVDGTSGEYIDKRCAEFGIKRKDGTKASAVLTISGTDGTIIQSGKVFLTPNGLEFITNKEVTITDGVAIVTASAAEVGESYNVKPGTITNQFVNQSGITSVTNATATGGTNPETDEALVTRLYEYLQKPSTSGNANHYKQWALAVDGVGSVKVTPLWDGPGTVRVLITGSNKGPVDETIVTICKNYIEENRPIGALVTVKSAEGLEINVNASITIESSTTIEIVQEAFKKALESYLSSIALEIYTVVYNRISYILLDIDGVIDYTMLTVNGNTANITISEEQTPIIGTVVIS